MVNNYTPSYNQYLTQTAGYALPSSVRTYSVFDPASNSWRRMTNDGRSPMPASPAQQQANIAGALAQARQTQGTVYPAQGMGQGQPIEMHPGYMNPPAQAPAQMPSGGSVRPSPASGGRGAVLVQGQPSRASQRAVEAPTVVQTGNPYMGYAEIRKEYGDPEADVAFLNEQPRGVLVAGKVNTRGVGDVQSPFAAPVDVVATNRGLPPTERPVTIYNAINAEHDNIPLRLHQAMGLLGGMATGKGLATYAADNAEVAAARKAYQEGMMRSQLRRAAPSRYTQTVHPEAPTIEAANRFSPMSSPWSPPQGTVTNNIIRTPTGATYTEKLALEAPVYPRYMNPPKPASIPNVISRADVSRASQAAENALRGRYSNVGGGLSTGKVIPRATVRLNTGDTSSIWANANRGFQRYQTLQSNPRAFEPIPSMLQQTYNARLGIPSIGFLVR